MIFFANHLSKRSGFCSLVLQDARVLGYSVDNVLVSSRGHGAKPNEVIYRVSCHVGYQLLARVAFRNIEALGIREVHQESILRTR
jgi:hypothetical protein